MVTLALAQLRCNKVAAAENLAAVGRVYWQADQQGASIVVSPEMSLTGYVDLRAKGRRSCVWMTPKSLRWLP